MIDTSVIKSITHNAPMDDNATIKTMDNGLPNTL